MPLSTRYEDAHEDYLKTIYSFTEWQDAPITPSVLAARLGLAPSTVTEMVKKLAAAGLAHHVKYGAITLTDAGRLRALAVIRRHRLIETWLVNEMGYTWDEVHDEAEVLEHALSDRLLDAIAIRLGDPRIDPHGDLIPTASGEVTRPDAHTLSLSAPGSEVTVVRIRDRDPEMLRQLAEHGIGPGSVVTLVTLSPTPVLRAHGTNIVLSIGADEMIWVANAG
ncbi:metal-dependent transcriptional regulator [Mycetocola tolaasinivorans]|uniref:Manganese transport regulator n=1 Tax=Mycetocola tolaasinivorans TaxID=76635 RepID=A0A3L7A686_9MICO|nr:metal-dependent transcriptional regulator [Mycetocola tolaasinivorans]RLP75350.1 metal-dependent transcriptional regulator [Mycetocola tolaasinivorans]